jgi:hypothetical protein
MQNQQAGRHRIHLPHLLFALLLLISSAFAVDPGSPPAVLSTANTIYTMTASYSGVANGYNITAANITLDCAGFSITGNNATGTYGVRSTATFTNVSNCNIGNFDDAIYLSGATSAYIANNNLSTTRTSGGYNSGEDIYEESTSGATFVNNTLQTSPGSGAAFFLYNGGANNLLANNTVTAKGANGYGAVAGIYFDQMGGGNNLTNNTIACSAGTYCVDEWASGKNYLINNTISGSTYSFYPATSTGTYAFSNNNFLSTVLIGTSGNTFNSDHITTTSGFSLEFSAGQRNNITNETITASGATTALYYTSAAGNGQILNSTINSTTVAVWLESGAANITLAGNSIYGSSASGTIHVDSGGASTLIMGNNTLYSALATTGNIISSSGGTLRNSTFINNTFIAKAAGANYIYLSASSGGNTFYWNNFTNTSGYYVNDTNGSNKYNTSTEGNIWYALCAFSNNAPGCLNYTSFTPINSAYGTGMYISDTPSNPCVSNTTWSSKIVGNVSDCRPLTTTIGACTESIVWCDGTTTGTTLFMNVPSYSAVFCYSFAPSVCKKNITLSMYYIDGSPAYSTGNTSLTYAIGNISLSINNIKMNTQYLTEGWLYDSYGSKLNTPIHQVNILQNTTSGGGSTTTQGDLNMFGVTMGLTAAWVFFEILAIYLFMPKDSYDANGKMIKTNHPVMAFAAYMAGLFFFMAFLFAAVDDARISNVPTANLLQTFITPVTMLLYASISVFLLYIFLNALIKGARVVGVKVQDWWFDGKW